MERGWIGAAAPCRRREGERGIVLIMTLWLILILGVTASYYARGLRQEAFIVRNYEESEQAELYAMAGIHHALAILGHPPDNGVNIDRNAIDLYFSGLRHADFDEGGYDVVVTDEERKININYASRDVIRSLLTGIGLHSLRADSIADAIIDWRDADDLPLLNGAESDYYGSLPTPYACRNAPFLAVEELLLVRGVTPGVLYGEEGRPSLVDRVTVQGKGKVNLNTADRFVIGALPGVDEQTALFVEEGRESIDYQPLSKNEFIQKVSDARPESNPGENNSGSQRLSRLVDTKSYHYRIESWGRVGDDGVERGIRVLVYRSMMGNRVNLRILSWTDLAGQGKAAS